MRKPWNITGWILLAAALALLAGCAASEPEQPPAAPLEVPPGTETPLTPEQLAERQREEEERRREEAEERRVAEEKRREEAEKLRKEEDKRRTAAVRAALGDVQLPPEQGLPGQSARTLPSWSLLELDSSQAIPPGTKLVPFDEAVPPLPKEPKLNVVVLGDADDPTKAAQVALIIGTFHRPTLERELGMAVKIAYVAQVKRNITEDLVIHYRPKFLKAALSVASVLPSPQNLSPMGSNELRQQGVDLVVYVGRNYK